MNSSRYTVYNHEKTLTEIKLNNRSSILGYVLEETEDNIIIKTFDFSSAYYMIQRKNRPLEFQEIVQNSKNDSIGTDKVLSMYPANKKAHKKFNVEWFYNKQLVSINLLNEVTLKGKIVSHHANGLILEIDQFRTKQLGWDDIFYININKPSLCRKLLKIGSWILGGIGAIFFVLIIISPFDDIVAH